MALDGVLVGVRVGRPDDDWLDTIHTTDINPPANTTSRTDHTGNSYRKIDSKEKSFVLGPR